MFISRKLNQDLKFREVKPAIVNQQCLVYQFQCNLCDAGYVGYTCGHLHERVDGHKQKSSSVCKHYLSEHNSDVPPFLSEQFHVLTKGSNKFDCFFIRKLKPSRAGGLDSRKGIHLKNLWSFVIMLICRDYRNQIFALFIHFALRMVSWWYRNVGF